MGQMYVPSGEHPGLYTAPGAPTPSEDIPGDVTHRTVAMGAMDTDKATLFLILGIGLAIAGYLSLENK